MIFWEADLSQIESRIVYMLTGDAELIRLARTKPWEFDQHTYNAAIIYNMAEAELHRRLKLPKTDPLHKEAKERRYVAKKTVHGAQRDMQAKRLVDTLLLDGFHISIPKAEAALTTYHNRFPAIREVYFKNIRRQLMREKLLVNSWGRRWDVRYDRLDDELFRQGYSWLPQSENADHLNQHGVKPVWLWLRAVENRPMNVQVHDSLAGSVSPENAYDLALYIKHCLEVPMLLAGNTLFPSVEFKLGTSWEAEHEFKRLPPRDEFLDIAHALERKVQATRAEQARRDV